MIYLSLQMFFVFLWYFSTYLLSVFGFKRLHINPSYPAFFFFLPHSQICNVPLLRLVRAQSGLVSAVRGTVWVCACADTTCLRFLTVFSLCITSLIFTRACFCSVWFFFRYWPNTKVLKRLISNHNLFYLSKQRHLHTCRLILIIGCIFFFLFPFFLFSKT